MCSDVISDVIYFRKGERRQKRPETRRGRSRGTRVYGSHHHHRPASPRSEHVTPSSSYLSFLRMQQHPTQPQIIANKKTIAMMKRNWAAPDAESSMIAIMKHTTAMM